MQKSSRIAGLIALLMGSMSLFAALDQPRRQLLRGVDILRLTTCGHAWGSPSLGCSGGSGFRRSDAAVVGRLCFLREPPGSDSGFLAEIPVIAHVMTCVRSFAPNRPASLCGEVWGVCKFHGYRFFLNRNEHSRPRQTIRAQAASPTTSPCNPARRTPALPAESASSQRHPCDRRCARRQTGSDSPSRPAREP